MTEVRNPQSESLMALRRGPLNDIVEPRQDTYIPAVHSQHERKRLFQHLEKLVRKQLTPS